MTALAGTLLALTFDQMADPGIAPSRLNAKVIREALVRQAVVQNSWPKAQMNITIVWDVVAQGLSRRSRRSRSSPTLTPSVTPCGSWTANRNARSRIQPPMAE